MILGDYTSVMERDRAILRAWTGGETMSGLVAQFGVGRSTIHNAISDGGGRTVLSYRIIGRLCRPHASLKQVALELGVSAARISKLRQECVIWGIPIYESAARPARRCVA